MAAQGRMINPPPLPMVLIAVNRLAANPRTGRCGLLRRRAIRQTLRVTPTMEAGIADHVWSIEEIGPDTAYARFDWDNGGSGAMQVRWQEGEVADLTISFSN